MDRARMKTFVLCLLLAVNLTFLSLLIADRLQEARLESAAKEELIQVLQTLGISLSYEAIPPTEEQAIYLLFRDIEAEGQVADRILIHPEARAEGGGIYHYFSAGGTAQFRTGSFHFDFGDYRLSPGENLQSVGDDMLERLGFQGHPFILRGDAQTGEITYIPTIDGFLVMGSQVVLRFSYGNLQEVSGPSLWGTRQRFAAGEQMDVTTALVRLAGHLYGRDPAPSQFASVQMGYYLLEGAGYLELRPVWIVNTDGGLFSVDRQSGEIWEERRT